MSNEKVKKTAELIDVMIQKAEKGPSGFLVEDREGCGNPEIFPDFAEGLKNGRLIQKEHLYCPWNTTILYGGKRGCLTTGCYHNCSIRDVKYLTPKMLRRLLSLFKNNLLSGTYAYGRNDDIKPIISEKETAYIKLQKENEHRKLEKEIEAEHRKQVKISSGWMKKYLHKFENQKEIRSLVTSFYCKKQSYNSFDYGLIFFDPDEKNTVAGAEKISYDEFIYIQLKSHIKRIDFLNCFINYPLRFRGCIEKINAKNICFKRIFVEGMYTDGECFDGKEDHVWMSKKGFERFKVGDSVSFFADVYRYLKTSNGKSLEYGLINPKGIKKIESYELPTDEQLMEDEIKRIICESCFLADQCSGFFCMRNKDELKKQREYMKKLISNKNEE